MTNRESRHRLIGFNRAHLPIDVNGIPDGAEYDPFLHIGDFSSHKSLSGGLNGIWSGRLHHLASTGEVNQFAVLEGNPNIVSIREQYPFLSDAGRKAAMRGELASRGHVMTIDYVVTLPPMNAGGPLRYLGLSRKEEYAKATPEGKQRASREAAALERIGWSWDYLKPTPTNEVRNNLLLRSYAKGHMGESIDDAAEDAAQLSSLIYRSTSRRGMLPLLHMLGRRLGISPSDTTFVFASAYYLGYLALDHSAALGEQSPIPLRPPMRRFGGGYERR